MFSGLYSALMLILFALILRGVSFEFRGHVDDPRWKAVWEFCTVFGSFLPALLLGVAFANIFQGIPIDEAGRFQGTLLTLLNPYGLLGGALFLLLFMVHGCIWLAVKSEGDIHHRSVALAMRLWWALLGVAAAFLAATYYATHLYDNYIKNPLFYSVPIVLIPVIAVGAMALIRIYLGKGRMWAAWTASSATIVSVTLFGVVGLYPNMLPSSLDPAFSLTIYNSASSQLTLKIMLAVALTFVPIVIAYQAWVYRLFRHKITEEDLAHDEGY